MKIIKNTHHKGLLRTMDQFENAGMKLEYMKWKKPFYKIYRRMLEEISPILWN